MTTQRIDIGTVKEAARNRWNEILQQLGGISADILDGRHHPCPKCGGTDRFRAFPDGTGGVICNQCNPEGCGDGLATLQWMKEDDFQTTLSNVADFVGVNRVGVQRASSMVDKVSAAKRMPLESFLAYGAVEADGKYGKVARIPIYNERGESHSHCDLSCNSKGFFKKGKGNSGLALPLNASGSAKLPEAGEKWIPSATTHAGNQAISWLRSTSHFCRAFTSVSCLTAKWMLRRRRRQRRGNFMV